MGDDFPFVLSGGLWVGGATATLLCEVLRLAAREARRNGGQLDPRLVALAEAADTVACRWKADLADDLRTVGIPHWDDPASIAYVETAEAARLLQGISTRAVRGLAERGTLPGQKVGKAWRFAVADVARLAHEREDKKYA